MARGGMVARHAPWWRRRWPHIYIQWPSRGPLVYNEGPQHSGALPPIATQWTTLGAEPVPLEEVMWGHEVGRWRPATVKQKIRRHRGGSRIKKWAQRRQASRGPLGAHLATHLCGIQWLRGWLASGGPLGGRWCYVCRETSFAIQNKRWFNGASLKLTFLLESV